MYGDSRGGLTHHRDEPLQGGTHTLLVYLTDAEGATFFGDNAVVEPHVGRAVLFGVRVPHCAIPCASQKCIVACEVMHK